MPDDWEATLRKRLDEEFGPEARSEFQGRLREVGRKIAPQIEQHVALARHTVDAVRLTLRCALPDSSLSGIRDSKRVTSQLLVQIAHDIQGIELLASAGLAYQAVALAASTFEHSMMIVSIGDSDERAREWLAHSQEEWNIDRVKPRVTRALDNLERDYPGLKSRLGDPYTGMYAKLCAFKHGNPLVQKHIAARRTSDGTQLEFFPLADRKAVIAAYWAIQTAVRVAWLSLVSYGTHHVSDSKRLHEIVRGINRSSNALDAIRVEREAAPA